MDKRKVYIILVSINSLVLLYGLGSYIYFTLKQDYLFSIFSVASFIPSLIGIAAIVIFISSGFLKSRMLRFFLCLKLLMVPSALWYYIKLFTESDHPYQTYLADNTINYSFYIDLFLTIVSSLSCGILLWLLQKEQKAKLTWIEYDNKQTGQFDPAEASARFSNRLIDGVLIVFLVATTFMGQVDYPGNIFGDGYFGWMVMEACASVVYYLLLEGIFNTTAGKCVTGTTVVNEDGQRPGFLQILTRTFCRLIPFEAFSFFSDGARGWHDTISNTYVTQSVHESDAAFEEITFDAETNPQEI